MGTLAKRAHANACESRAASRRAHNHASAHRGAAHILREHFLHVGHYPNGDRGTAQLLAEPEVRPVQNIALPVPSVIQNAGVAEFGGQPSR